MVQITPSSGCLSRSRGGLRFSVALVSVGFSAGGLAASAGEYGAMRTGTFTPASGEKRGSGRRASRRSEQAP